MLYNELDNRLPTAQQSFPFIRRFGLTYADKSEFVYKLARDSQPRILIRPRRFGKSTLLSTLEELFLHGVKPYDGHDSCFKGLAIEKTWQDEGHYLVLHLDLYCINSCCSRVEQFHRKLIYEIASFCKEHQLPVRKDAQDFTQVFGDMLRQLPPSSLVLLVDEYDAPMLDYRDNAKELRACRLLMQSLFGLVKRHAAKFRCVFFTGITRFQGMDLGLSAGSFTDITHQSAFAACCGFTRGELMLYFKPHLRHAAAVRLGLEDEEVTKAQTESLIDAMVRWYGGYAFDGTGEGQVLSTWSVLRFFGDRKARLQVYWSHEEGLGFFRLMKKLFDSEQPRLLLEKTGTGIISVSEGEFLEASPVNKNSDAFAMLVPFGYLTLKDPFTPGNGVHLECPNQEIRRAFVNLLAERLFKPERCYPPSYAQKTVEVLTGLNPDAVDAYFNELLSALPREDCPLTDASMVAALISINFLGTGLKPRTLTQHDRESAAIVLDVPWLNLTFVFECRFEESADEYRLDAGLNKAMEQLKARKGGLQECALSHVARFAMVFCASEDKRSIERVALVDVMNRQLSFSPALHRL